MCLVQVWYCPAATAPTLRLPIPIPIAVAIPMIV
jgi:hypothetical protein